MPRDSLSQARTDRNAALLDTMVLGGHRRREDQPRRAQDRCSRRVIERPEFEGVRAQELSAMVEASGQAPLHGRSLEDLLHGIRETAARSPQPPARLRAGHRGGARRSQGHPRGAGAAQDLPGVASASARTRSRRCSSASRPAPRWPRCWASRSSSSTPRRWCWCRRPTARSRQDELSAMLENLAGDPVFQEASLEAAQPVPARGGDEPHDRGAAAAPHGAGARAGDPRSAQPRPSGWRCASPTPAASPRPPSCACSICCRRPSGWPTTKWPASRWRA